MKYVINNLIFFVFIFIITTFLTISPIFSLETGTDLYPGVVPIYIDNKFQCSGSIIGNNSVLTSSHCFYKLFEENIELVKRGSPYWSLETNRVMIILSDYSIVASSVYINSKCEFATDKLKSSAETSILLFGDNTFDRSLKIKISSTQIQIGDKVVILGYGSESSTDGGKKRKIGKNIYCHDFIDGDKRLYRENGEIVIDQKSECNKNLPQYQATTRAGDSGGPLLLESTGEIIGINSWTPWLSNRDYFAEILFEDNLNFLNALKRIGADIEINKQ